MKQIVLAFILILILSTSLVKNSTKEIEDKIFTINQNIRSLNLEFEDIMLEFNYLSSPEKLTQHQSQYFKNDLKEVDINKIRTLLINDDYLETADLIRKNKKNE